MSDMYTGYELSRLTMCFYLREQTDTIINGSPFDYVVNLILTILNYGR